MEQVSGIEPPSQPWQGSHKALANNYILLNIFTVVNSFTIIYHGKSININRMLGKV